MPFPSHKNKTIESVSNTPFSCFQNYCCSEPDPHKNLFTIIYYIYITLCAFKSFCYVTVCSIKHFSNVFNLEMSHIDFIKCYSSIIVSIIFKMNVKDHATLFKFQRFSQRTKRKIFAQNPIKNNFQIKTNFSLTTFSRFVIFAFFSLGSKNFNGQNIFNFYVSIWKTIYAAGKIIYFIVFHCSTNLFEPHTKKAIHSCNKFVDFS